MRAAILHEYGVPPEPGEFRDPEPGDGQEVVEVLAAGLNPVDVSIASGTFYGGRPPLPCVVGREGVGRRTGGERVYFDGSAPPFGSFAQRAPIDPQDAIPLPEGLDEALAVCFGIAGLAAWLGLEWRGGLRQGETVLVLGASGVVGRVAVQAARLLGATRVVAAARSREGLEQAVELGADATVQIGAVDDLAGALAEAAGGGVDVILDPVWGEPASAALQAANRGGRLVQIGQSAGPEALISSAAVRGRVLEILGHTNFAAPREIKRAAYERMAAHAAAGELRLDVERVPLEDVADAWARQQASPHRKLVIVP
ncbi:MAG TPA: zinc-binding alcohol dehydrogenase family protein [Solirubrobacteraceae bacterium]|nr:zinc-binding alcohol dehydrogenase family protein [Solirubrobacteraceae bacterium]